MRSSGRSGGHDAAQALCSSSPRHGNPSGASLDKDRRAKLAALARAPASTSSPTTCTRLRATGRALPCGGSSSTTRPTPRASRPPAATAADPAAAAGATPRRSPSPTTPASCQSRPSPRCSRRGCGLGWIEAAPRIISAVARSGLRGLRAAAARAFTEQIVARVLESGDADAHLDAMRQRCRRPLRGIARRA